MIDHNFTDEEVIKVLEWCGKPDIESHCKGCPLYEYGSSMCIQTAMGAALALINRQKAEIERLQKHSAEQYKDGIKDFAEKVKPYESKIVSPCNFCKNSLNGNRNKICDEDLNCLGFSKWESLIEKNVKELILK